MKETIASLAIYAVVFALLICVPRLFEPRTRTIAGVVLFLGGLVGVVLGLALLDTPFLESENAALTWMGISAAAMLVGIYTFASSF